MFTKTSIVIFLITVFGLLLRIYRLDAYPPSLNWDEVSHGYNAYSILKTGSDEWGEKFPNIFKAYGDFKLPTYIYTVVPSVAIFGLNAFATRLPSALAGALLIYLTYKLSCEFTHKNTHRLFFAFSISILGWHIFLSRMALEANLFLTIFVFSIYSIIKKRPNLSLFLFGICLLTYNSSRVVLPFYFIFLFIYLKPKLKDITKGLFFFTFFIYIFITQTLAESGKARLKWVNIVDQGAINYLNEQRGKNNNSVFSKIAYNKPVYFLQTSFKNYIKILDPTYIFSTGSKNFQFNIPDFPPLLPLLLPFYIIGIIAALRKQGWLIYWWLVSPLPSAITKDAPHTLRTNIFLYISTLLCLYGIITLAKKWRYVVHLFAIALVIFFIYFTQEYINYSKSYSWVFQDGYQQLFGYLTRYTDKKIYITKKLGEPHIFYNFYNLVDPADFQKNRVSEFHTDWYWTNSYKNISFVNDWEVPNLKPESGSIVISSTISPPKNLKVLDQIKDSDQNTVFLIYAAD